MSRMTDKEIIKEKIKAIYPHIVVGGDIDKPCYNIHWYDIEQKTMICGFGSYKLELVRKWLEEEFEVVESDIDNLIKSQQAEIERLTRELDIALENDASKIYPYEVITPYGVVFSKREKGYEDFKMDIKAETIKEFADRLKEKAYRPNPYPYIEILTKEDIDNLVKEMVGDNK